MRKFRILIPLFMLILSTVIFISGVSVASADQYFSGEGTLNSPFKINTAEELIKLSELVNADQTNAAYSGKHYLQTANITLSASFVPIGTVQGGFCPFRGVYDGAGYTISNLQVAVNTSAGLFGYCVDSTVKNLGIRSGSIKGAGESGGIAGRINETSLISNCFNGAEISASSGFAGGIVGLNKGKITYSYNTGSVSSLSGTDTSSHAAGGIAGCNVGTKGYSAGFISNVFSIGTVTSASVAAGGIVGLNSASETEDPGTVDNAFFNIAGTAKAVGFTVSNATPFYLKALSTSEMVTLPENPKPKGFLSITGEYVFNDDIWTFEAPALREGSYYDCFYPQLKVFHGIAPASAVVNVVPYTVVFDRQDGTTPVTEKVYEGEKLKSSGAVKPSGRAGYTFLYWYSLTGGEEIIFSADEKVYGNLHLFAAWEFNKLSVILSAKDNVYTAEYGTPITLIATVTQGLPPYIEWYKMLEGTPVFVTGGQSYINYSITEVNGSGDYFCRVTVGDGENLHPPVDSEIVRITIKKLIIPVTVNADNNMIDYSPDDKITITASLGIDIKAYMGTPYVEWYKEGTAEAVAKGSNLFTYVLSTVGDSGKYYCVISVPGNGSNISPAQSDAVQITINGADPEIPYIETLYSVNYKEGLTLGNSGISLPQGFSFEFPGQQLFASVGEYSVNVLYDPKKDPAFMGNPENYNVGTVEVTIIVNKGSYSAEEIPAHSAIDVSYREELKLRDIELDYGFKLDTAKSDPDKLLETGNQTLYAIYNADSSNYNDYSSVRIDFIVKKAETVISVEFVYGDIIFTDMILSELNEFLVITYNKYSLEGVLSFRGNKIYEGLNAYEWYFVPADKNYALAEGMVYFQAYVKIISQGIYVVSAEDGEDIRQKTVIYDALNPFDPDSVRVYEYFNVGDPKLLELGTEGYGVEYYGGKGFFIVCGNEETQIFKVLYADYVFEIELKVVRIDYESNAEFIAHMSFAESGGLTIVYSPALTAQSIYNSITAAFIAEFGSCHIAGFSSSADSLPVSAGNITVSGVYYDGDNNYLEKEVTLTYVITKTSYQNITHSKVVITYFIGVCLNDAELSQYYSWVEGETRIYVVGDTGDYVGYRAVYNSQPQNYEDYELFIYVKVEKADYALPFEEEYEVEFEYDTEEKKFELDEDVLPQVLSIIYVGENGLALTDAGTIIFYAHFINTDNNFNTPSDIKIILTVTPRRISADFDELLKGDKEEFNEGFTAEVRINAGSNVFTGDVVSFIVVNVQTELEVLRGTDQLVITGLSAGYYKVIAHSINPNYILVGSVERGFMIKQMKIESVDGILKVFFMDDGVIPEARLVVTSLSSEKINGLNRIIRSESYKVDEVYSVALLDGGKAVSFNGKIKVSIAVGENYQSRNGLKVIIVGKDNTISYADSKLIDGFLVFETTSLADFAVAYEYEWPALFASLLNILLILGASMVLLIISSIMIKKSIGKR